MTTQENNKIPEDKPINSKRRAMGLFDQYLRTMNIDPSKILYTDYYFCFISWLSEIQLSKYPKAFFCPVAYSRWANPYLDVRFKRYQATQDTRAEDKIISYGFIQPHPMQRRRSEASVINTIKELKPVKTPSPQTVNEGYHSLFEYLYYIKTVSNLRENLRSGYYELKGRTIAKDKPNIVRRLLQESSATSPIRNILRANSPALQVNIDWFKAFDDHLSNPETAAKPLYTAGFNLVSENVYALKLQSLIKEGIYKPRRVRMYENTYIFINRHNILNGSSDLAFDADELNSEQDVMSENRPEGHIWLKDRKCYVLNKNAPSIPSQLRDHSGFEYLFSVRPMRVYGNKRYTFDRDAFLANKEVYKRDFNLVWSKLEKAWVLKDESAEVFSSQGTSLGFISNYHTKGDRYFKCVRCNKWYCNRSRNRDTSRPSCVCCIPVTRPTSHEAEQRATLGVRQYNFNVLDVHPIDPELVNGKKHKRLFGVEVEAAYLNGTPDSQAEYTEQRKALAEIEQSHWIAKHDGSIRGGGIEFVSKPDTLEKQEEEIKRLYENSFFKAKLNPVHESCGLHVHISRDSTTEWGVYQLREFFSNPVNETFLDKIAGRRANNYCLRGYAKKRYRFSILDPETGVEMKVCSDSEKYRALNTLKDETIEFRLFAGAPNPEVLMTRLQFCDALTEYFQPSGNPYKAKERLDYRFFMEWLLDNRKPQWSGIVDLVKKSVDIKPPDVIKPTTINTVTRSTGQRRIQLNRRYPVPPRWFVPEPSTFTVVHTDAQSGEGEGRAVAGNWIIDNI